MSHEWSLETSSSRSGSILQPIATEKKKKKNRRKKKKALALCPGDAKSFKISEHEPYIISLDSLDLKYIHTNINSNMAGVTPIWNRTPKTYFEFVVVSDASHSEEETDYNEASGGVECQICHICDIEVPVIFLKDHYNSEKHRLFQKLTKAVLVRAAKSMDSCQNMNKTNINNDIYYCPSCSLSVLEIHKQLHDKSTRHLSSHKYDEDMSSFIKLYLNRDSGTKKFNNYNEKMYFSNDSEEINLKNDYEKMNSDNHNEESNLKNDNDQTHLIINNNDNSIQKMITKNENDQEIKKIMTLQLYDCNVILNVPRYKYHGLEIYANRIYCKICDYTVEGSIDTHIDLIVHRLKSHNRINNHGIRKLISNVNHCIVCNLLISQEHTDKHTTEDSVHNKLLNSYIDTSKVTESPKPPKRTYCKPCDRLIDTHNYQAHIKSKPHKSKTHKNSEPPSNTIQNVKSPYDINCITIGSNLRELKCELCKVKIPNTDQNINEHIKAKRHKENLLKITNESSKTSCVDDLNVLLTKTDVNNSGEHVIDNLTTPKFVLASNGKELKCELCKVILPNTENSINEHIKAKRHKANLLKLTNENSKTSSVDDLIARFINRDVNDSGENVIESLSALNTNKVLSREDYCEICQVKLPKTGKLIHDMGKKHKTNLIKKSKDIPSC